MMTRNSARGRCLQSLDVFVLAGGLGTRISPLLGDTPKVLASIDGRPFLHYLLEWLRSFGARRIVLGLGHKAEAVLAYLGSHPVEGIEVVMVVEPSPLGTAGAIRYARRELISDPVLVMNGDSFVDADLCDLVARHHAAGKRGTILCTEVEDARRFGTVELDDEGLVVGFREKNSAVLTEATISAGVYALSAGLLDDIVSGNASSLEKDVFELQPPGSLAVLSGRFEFVDIGTPESLVRSFEVLNRIVPREAFKGRQPNDH